MRRTRHGYWLGWFLALYAHSGVAAQLDVEQASATQTEHAREAFQAGKSAFEQGRHDEALRHFGVADQTVTSPNAKLMIARCLVQLHRLAEAHAVFRALIDEARSHADGRYEQAAQAAAQEQLALEPQLALLTVQVRDETSAATLAVAGRAVPRAAWAAPIAVDPGVVEVALVGSAGQRDQRTLELAAGATATLELSIAVAVEVQAAAPRQQMLPAAAPPRARAVTRPSAEPKPSLRTLGYVAGAAGIAGIAAFAIFGALSNAEIAELERECPERTGCAASLQDTAERGRTYQTLANVSLGVGATALGAGVVLWVIGAPDESVEVGVGATGIRVRGAL